MDEDKIEFLDGETPEMTAEPATDEPEKVEAEAGEPEPKEAEAEEAEAETGEEDTGSTPEPEPKEPTVVPVTALLDEREKRQLAQRDLESTQRQVAELRSQLQQAQKPQEQVPDWFEDPVKAAQLQKGQMEQQFQQRLMQMSKFQAEREFGSEVVGEAIAYFDQHPQQSQQFMQHPSPFHAAVEFYQRQKVAEEIGTDPDAYKARLREELRAEFEAELKANSASAQPSKPKAPPPSMASAPSTGAETLSPGNTFDEMFPA